MPQEQDKELKEKRAEEIRLGLECTEYGLKLGRELERKEMVEFVGKVFIQKLEGVLPEYKKNEIYNKGWNHAVELIIKAIEKNEYTKKEGRNKMG